MEIRDALYGSVSLDGGEARVLDSRYFQRLRHIRQLGLSEYSYPSATHNRYIHSVGAMHVASRALETIFGLSSDESAGDGELSHRNKRRASWEVALQRLPRSAYLRFRSLVRLAALLHDIGHGPLSHALESAMPSRESLWAGSTPVSGVRTEGQANHEDYTLKIILDSDLTGILNEVGRKYGFRAEHVAALIDPSVQASSDPYLERIEGAKIDFRPLLQQLISSELDCDRMDYLQRDSFFAGVNYGRYDYDWLSRNLTASVQGEACFLALHHRALYAFEDFLISRFHMFLMVYFHHKSIVYEEMFKRYFETSGDEYPIPSDLTKYLECVDSQLFAKLSHSKNPWAERITARKPYQLLCETQSGIPAQTEAQAESMANFQKIILQLKNKSIPFIETSTKGELSKYRPDQGPIIYVRYDDLFSQPQFIPLRECTDLFKRYQEQRFINRIYVDPQFIFQAREMKI